MAKLLKVLPMVLASLATLAVVLVVATVFLIDSSPVKRLAASAVHLIHPAICDFEWFIVYSGSKAKRRAALYGLRLLLGQADVGDSGFGVYASL